MSRSYQSFLLRTICKRVNEMLVEPLKQVGRWKEFQSWDPYHETVTAAREHYEYVMASALQPPSNMQLAMPSTLERHQEKLPTSPLLSAFDYHSIESLLCLRKPINSASYRELALGINYLTFLDIRQSIFHIQLEREAIIDSY